MIFLIDSSSLMFSKNYHYQFNRVPQFWDWLVFHAEEGSVKFPVEIFEEILRQDDELKVWAKKNKEVLILDDLAYHGLLAEVTNNYVHAPSDADIERMGKDPYLIACALYYKRLGKNAVVVTEEKSKPKALGAGRHIPDVCDDLKISWCNVGGLVKRPGLVTQLNFSTNIHNN